MTSIEDFGFPVTADQWRALADKRLLAAHALRKEGLYEGALEQLIHCMDHELKAVIAQKRRVNTWPAREDEPGLYTHNLTKLAKIAGIHGRILQLRKENRRMFVSWQALRDLSVEVRYSVGRVDMRTLSDIFQAVENTTYGVREWLRKQ